MSNPDDLEIVVLFDAPRELVFRNWTEAAKMQTWFAPDGSVVTACEVSAHPGGRWRVEFRAADGTECLEYGEFREVVEPERLVFTSTALEDEDGKPLFEILNTVTFEDFHGITKLTLHARLVTKDFQLTAQVAAALAGMEQGWSESLYRLGDELDNSLNAAMAEREIVISRVFDAPREVVWNAWTDPNQVVQWWGPRGFTTTIHEMDVRPGGAWRHTMHGPDGANYPGKSVFSEVVKPERIVLTHSGGKEGGRVVNFKSTWTFEAEGDQTRVTIRMVFDSAEAREFVAKEHGAIEGGKQTLQRLGEHVRDHVTSI